MPRRAHSHTEVLEPVSPLNKVRVIGFLAILRRIEKRWEICDALVHLQSGPTVRGPAQYVVPELARELAVDLEVMGTIARTGFYGFFMGNTAESILGELDCSVLTMKPPGFTSPVTLEG